LGDYEIDLIVGPKNRGAILSIIDRVSRKCLLEKLTGKTASEVATGVIAALLPYKSFIFTITSDNGTEFTHHEEIAKALGIQYYFANPYASYERGSIENLNGLVRQYIPKGTDFNLISPEEIKVIEEKLNNRPRKVLDYWTPNEFLRQNMMKVA
jgi:IS30 family transposase